MCAYSAPDDRAAAAPLTLRQSRTSVKSQRLPTSNLGIRNEASTGNFATVFLCFLCVGLTGSFITSPRLASSPTK